MVVSLYFHIPFCKRKCDYCHFFVLPDREDLKKQFLQALRLEWQMRKKQLAGKRILSIYFGGGTPSLLGPEAIAEILSWCEKPEEVTLEANPENFSTELFQAYKKAGINRLSFGVQSFDDALLKKLSRTHEADEASKAICDAHRIGFENISIDLMYDLPGQTLQMWQHTIQEANALPLSHLSLYNLTFEPHTVFYKKRELLKKTVPDEETSAKMYLTAIQELNLKQYEISAFGSPSIHNKGYWTARPFLGFGPSAFSYWEGVRFRNFAHLGKYSKAIHAGLFPVDFEEKLDPEASIRELLAVHLRLLEGVYLNDFSLSSETQETIEKLKKEGFLGMTKNRLTLTERGLLFYDLVASEII